MKSIKPNGNTRRTIAILVDAFNDFLDLLGAQVKAELLHHGSKLKVNCFPNLKRVKETTGVGIKALEKAADEIWDERDNLTFLFLGRQLPGADLGEKLGSSSCNCESHFEGS